MCGGCRGLHAQNYARWWQGRVRRRDVARQRGASWQRQVLRRAAARWALCGVAAMFLVSLIPLFAHAQAIPREAQQYRLVLKREAHRAWGLGAPVATFAAQIHQESRWRSDARSGVGALGLAQFMPATAHWIGGLDAGLTARAPLNPTWALRALVVYDRWLFDRVRAANGCEQMAFALSGYNGGLGWVYKRQALARQQGVAADVCMGAACDLNPGISPASQRENAHYPQVILLKFEPLYAATGRWGAGGCR